MKVFLGGTVNNSSWREELIPMLVIDYFNPVIKEWDEEAYQIELREREICDYCLYVITPKMDGIYSIAEAVDDSNKHPEKTIFCFLLQDGLTTFTSHQIKSLEKTKIMIIKNGGLAFDTLEEVAGFLNASLLGTDQPLI
ncbi:nucleoside 2-deoxyribosyltransferase domain-containing protein [Limibacter armeniacum]|uniref:nucleoside 2-deoxyribosyltransferase domain-containing protein n=1 Tax=Limibacter armeniacum TaxID=466084 RepID=UPI002FE54918